MYCMVRSAHNFQIRQIVVRPICVSVMNAFRRQQSTSKKTLHDHPVLHYISSIYSNSRISFRISSAAAAPIMMIFAFMGALQGTCFMLMHYLARFATEICATLYVRWPNKKLRTTGYTDSSNFFAHSQRVQHILLWCQS